MSPEKQRYTFCIQFEPRFDFFLGFSFNINNVFKPLITTFSYDILGLMKHSLPLTREVAKSLILTEGEKMKEYNKYNIPLQKL